VIARCCCALISIAVIREIARSRTRPFLSLPAFISSRMQRGVAPRPAQVNSGSFSLRYLGAHPIRIARIAVTLRVLDSLEAPGKPLESGGRPSSRARVLM
jgi:hypothetical protein